MSTLTKHYSDGDKVVIIIGDGKVTKRGPVTRTGLEYLAYQRLNQDLLNLALLQRYFTYVMCTCEHCVGPGREHRYELMAECTKVYASKVMVMLKEVDHKGVCND